MEFRPTAIKLSLHNPQGNTSICILQKKLLVFPWWLSWGKYYNDIHWHYHYMVVTLFYNKHKIQTRNYWCFDFWNVMPCVIEQNHMILTCLMVAMILKGLCKHVEKIYFARNFNIVLVCEKTKKTKWKTNNIFSRCTQKILHYVDKKCTVFLSLLFRLFKYGHS